MSAPARWASRLLPLLVLVLWLGVGGGLGPYAGRLGEVATNDQAAFLPRSAESTRVLRAQEAFRQEKTLPALVVWSADGGGPVDPTAQATATRSLASLTGTDGVVGAPSPAFPSADGEALRGIVQLRPDLGDELAVTLGRSRPPSPPYRGPRCGWRVPPRPGRISVMRSSASTGSCSSSRW